MDSLSNNLADISMDDATGAENIYMSHNGTMGTIDLAKPVDHVGERGKVVITNTVYTADLNGAYQLWRICGSPDAFAMPTASQLDEWWPVYSAVYCRALLYGVAYYVGYLDTDRTTFVPTIPLQFRATDQFPADGIKDRKLWVRFVRKFHGKIVGNEATKHRLAESGPDLLLSIVANAIHREQNSGHNWFTEKARDKRSVTGKTLPVAGASVDLFSNYMMTHGHDGNHHLSHESLAALASALCGAGVFVISRDSVQYAGREVRGLTFREVFIVPESASDRYPPSVLGKAALIVGLDMMLAMFNDLTTKAKIPNIGILTGPIAAMATTVRTAAVDRERCRQIEASLGGTMAICYGYVTDRRLMEADAFKIGRAHV